VCLSYKHAFLYYTNLNVGSTPIICGLMYNLWSLHTWSTRNKIFISIVRGCTPTSKSFIGDIRIYINACYAEKNQRRKFLYNWKNLTSNYNISVIDVIKLRTKLRSRITEYNEKDASPVRPRDWLNYASVSRREKKKKIRAAASDRRGFSASHTSLVAPPQGQRVLHK